MNKAFDAVATIRQDPLGKRGEIMASLWAAITRIHNDTNADRSDVLNVEANRPLRTLFSLVSGMSGVHVDVESIMDAADRVISLLDPQGETSPIQRAPLTPAIPARVEAQEQDAVMAFVHSDDQEIEFSVDARHFLRHATAEEIKDLLDCDCRGDYPADQIFHAAEVAGDDEAKKLIDYLNSGVRLPNGDPMGFEVVAWTDEVTAWLEKNRPDVLAEALQDPSPEIG